jgi:hypothetical protein
MFAAIVTPFAVKALPKEKCSVFNTELILKRKEEILPKNPAAATIVKVEEALYGLKITLSSSDHGPDGMRSYPVYRQCVLFENGELGYIVEVNRITPFAHVVYARQMSLDKPLPKIKPGESVVFYSPYGYIEKEDG